MVKWFNENLERNRLRGYTKRQLSPNWVDKLFKRISLTNWIIIANVLVFILLTFVINFTIGLERFVELFGLQVNSFLNGNYWNVFTSMFIHVEFWHLFANMISLFFIGNLIEKIIGRKRFFMLYILSGILAGLFFVLSVWAFSGSYLGARILGTPEIIGVGASGAIFALAGLLAVLTPNLRVYLIAGPIFAIILQVLLPSIVPSGLIDSINLILSIYIFVAIFSIFSFNPIFRKVGIPLGMPIWVLPFVAIVPLVIIDLIIDLPIGNAVHFGGLLVGLLYGFWLRHRYPKKVQYLGKVFR